MQQLSISCTSSPHKTDFYKSNTTKYAISQLNKMLSGIKNTNTTLKRSVGLNDNSSLAQNQTQQPQYGYKNGSNNIKKKLEQMITEGQPNHNPQQKIQITRKKDSFLKGPPEMQIPTCKTHKKDSFYSPIKLKKDELISRPSLIHLEETVKEKRQTNKHISSSNMFDKYKEIDSVQKFERGFSHDYNQSLLQKTLSENKGKKDKTFLLKQGLEFL